MAKVEATEQAARNLVPAVRAWMSNVLGFSSTHVHRNMGQDVPPVGDRDDDDDAVLTKDETETFTEAAVAEADLASALESLDMDEGGDLQQTGPTTKSSNFPFTIPVPTDLSPGEARVGISGCLLGHEVRFNAGHCNSSGLKDGLGKLVKFIPVCPEMDIGLGCPRPTLRLVVDEDLPRDIDIEDLAKRVRLIQTGKDNVETADLTETMAAYAAERVAYFKSLGLDGFVLKKDSPSCGYDRVKVYTPDGRGRKVWKGSFAAELVRQWPELPIEDEGRLNDEDLRNNFITRVSCHHRWRTMDSTKWKNVLAFHQEHKFLLMVYSPQSVQSLGRMLAAGPKKFTTETRDMYYHQFFTVTKKLATRGNINNVLLHVAKYLKNTVSELEYKILIDHISRYHRGEVPLVVPLTLINLFTARMSPSDSGAYIADQRFLNIAPPSQKLGTQISPKV